MLLVSLAWAECPAISPLLDHAREALLDERLDTVQADLQATDAAFLCTPAYPDQLARFYLLTAAVMQLSHTGDPAPYYLASRRLIPEPDLQLGADIVAAFRAVPDPDGHASLSLDPRQSAWVDGKLVPEGTVDLPPGIHFVQVRDANDTVLFARTLTLDADQDITLSTGLVVDVPEVQAEKRGFPGFLVGGLVLAGAGTGAALWAMQQDAVIEASYQGCMDSAGACDEDGFLQAGKTGDILSAGAYALWGLGAAGIVLEFVLPVGSE